MMIIVIIKIITIDGRLICYDHTMTIIMMVIMKIT